MTAFDQIPMAPRLESLEPRLLMSVATLAEPSLAAVGDGLIFASISPSLEAESNGGAANNDLATAQALSFSYLLPGDLPGEGVGPMQAAVLGVADGVGEAEASQDSILLFGRISYPTVYEMNLSAGVVPGGDGVLTIAAKADLAGPEKYLTVSAEGIDLGYVFVEDGLDMVTSKAQLVIPAATLKVLAADGVVSIELSPSAAVSSASTGYIVSVLDYSGAGGAGTADFYSVDLEAGDWASIAIQGSGEVDLQLLDADGALLGEGVAGAEGLSAVIEQFSVEQDGTYYLRVAGSGEYALAVNRNATTALDDNIGIDSAQQVVSPKVNGRRWAVGHVSAFSTEADYFAFTLTADSKLDLRTYAPGNDLGLNALDPVVYVYDSSGALLASGGGSLQFRAEDDGEYFVSIESGDDAGGGYVLSVKSQLRPNKGGGSQKRMLR